MTATLPRRRPHPGLGHHRARRRGGRRARAASSSRATSADRARPSCATRPPSSTAPTTCSWNRPTAAASTSRRRRPSASWRRSSRPWRRAAGVLLIPAFAIGRTQEIVWQLDRLLSAGAIPHVPLYLDSPMASHASDIYRRYPGYYDDETHRLLEARRDAARLPRRGRHQRRRAVTGHRARAPADDDRGRQRHAHRRPRRAPPARPHRRPGGDCCCSWATRARARSARTSRPARATVRLDGAGARGALPGPLDQRLHRPRRRERAARLAGQPGAGARAGPRRCSWCTATRRPRRPWCRRCARSAWSPTAPPGARRSSSTDRPPVPGRLTGPPPPVGPSRRCRRGRSGRSRP